MRTFTHTVRYMHVAGLQRRDAITNVQACHRPCHRLEGGKPLPLCMSNAAPMCDDASRPTRYNGRGSEYPAPFTRALPRSPAPNQRAACLSSCGPTQHATRNTQDLRGGKGLANQRTRHANAVTSPCLHPHAAERSVWPAGRSAGGTKGGGGSPPGGGGTSAHRQGRQAQGSAVFNNQKTNHNKQTNNAYDLPVCTCPHRPHPSSRHSAPVQAPMPGQTCTERLTKAGAALEPGPGQMHPHPDPHLALTTLPKRTTAPIQPPRPL